jgi:hypothetical protein
VHHQHPRTRQFSLSESIRLLGSLLLCTFPVLYTKAGSMVSVAVCCAVQAFQTNETVHLASCLDVTCHLHICLLSILTWTAFRGSQLLQACGHNMTGTACAQHDWYCLCTTRLVLPVHNTTGTACAQHDCDIACRVRSSLHSMPFCPRRIASLLPLSIKPNQSPDMLLHATHVPEHVCKQTINSRSMSLYSSMECQAPAVANSWSIWAR